MRTLHLYLLRQVLATLLMTVFIFTFVLLLGNGIKEILDLLIRRQATFGLVLHAIALLIPFVLAFALPIGMLTAALLVFGRFSADQELTAARASGISLISLVAPILFLSVVLSGVCAWLNFEVAPSCRVAYKELLFKAGMARPSGALPSNQYVTFGKYTVYAGKVEEDGVHLQNVIVYEADDKGDSQRWIKAPSGKLVSNPQSKQIVLTLEHPAGAWRDDSGWAPAGDSGEFTFPIEVNSPKERTLNIPLSDMTLAQLWVQLGQLEHANQHTRPLRKNPAPPLTQPALPKFAAVQTDLTMPILVQIHRQTAFSFACIGFTLIGIPLGIRAHRRETSVGMAMALVLVLIYYSFVILGQAWESHPERAPHLVFWVVGAVLLWRANRGV
jgi:lipopolysaccharide export system permease protein